MGHVEIREVTKAYGKTVAVDKLDLDENKGEFLTLLGPSGCGKTTTLRLVAGLIEPTAGEISVAGELMSSSRQGIVVPPEKRRMGMVFQSYAVWPHMNIFKNVAFPLHNLQNKPSKEEISKKVGDVLELVKLGGLEERYPSTLSGGQQQRVALARALVVEPSILLFDEPLSNLDAKLREEMRFELKELQQRIGVTSLYVTHDQAEAMVLSDRVAVMSEGKVTQIGTPREIYDDPKDRFTAEFIGLANFLLGKLSDRGLVSLTSGETLEFDDPGKLPVGGEVLVSIRPQNVQLMDAGVKQANSIRGVVKIAAYLGDRVDYRISIENREVRVQTPSGQTQSTGEEVTLFLPRDRITVVPA